MKIIWHGHSCFEVRGDSISVVFDPFEPGYVPGFKVSQLEADYCFCSHDHGDHNYAAGVTVTKNSPSLKYRFIDTFHDEEQGRLRGNNRVTVVEIDGKNVAHMGDIGHLLTDSQIRSIGKIDILLLPVGGFYTVDATVAKKISDSLNPDITIPMHYRGEGFGFDVLSTVDAYTSLCEDVTYISSNSFDTSQTAVSGTVVLTPPVA